MELPLCKQLYTRLTVRKELTPIKKKIVTENLSIINILTFVYSDSFLYPFRAKI